MTMLRNVRVSHVEAANAAIAAIHHDHHPAVFSCALSSYSTPSVTGAPDAAAGGPPPAPPPVPGAYSHVRYWKVRGGGHVGMYRESRRVGRLNGDRFESVSLELPAGVVGRGRFETDYRSFEVPAGVVGGWSNGLTLELQVNIVKYPRKDVLESGEGAFLKWLMKWSNEDEARSRGPPDAAALAVFLANTATGGFSGEKGGEGVSVGPSVKVGDIAGDEVAFDDPNASGEGQIRSGERHVVGHLVEHVVVQVSNRHPPSVQRWRPTLNRLSRVRRHPFRKMPERATDTSSIASRGALELEPASVRPLVLASRLLYSSDQTERERLS